MAQWFRGLATLTADPDSQNPHGGSQLFITLVLGGLMLFSGLEGHCMHVGYMNSCKYTHTKTLLSVT